MTPMRWLTILVLCLFSSAPIFAEQVVERQGWKVLTFDVPGMELRGSKDGGTTRATYARKVGETGEVKITIQIKSWLAIDTYEKKFREDKERARASGESRLRPQIEVPGASKVLSYTDTEPYDAEVIVLYTKDFRCQLAVTSSADKESKAEIEPTYQQLTETLRMGGLSPISPIRVESEKDEDEQK